MGEKTRAVGNSLLAACFNKVKYSLLSCMMVKRKRINFISEAVDEGESDDEIVKCCISLSLGDGDYVHQQLQDESSLITCGARAKSDDWQQLQQQQEMVIMNYGNVTRLNVKAAGNSAGLRLRRYNSASLTEANMVENDWSGTALMKNPGICAYCGCGGVDESRGIIKVRRGARGLRESSTLLRSNSSRANVYLLGDPNATTETDDHNGNVDGELPMYWPPAPPPPPPLLPNSGADRMNGAIIPGLHEPAVADRRRPRRSKSRRRQRHLKSNQDKVATGEEVPSSDRAGRMRRVHTTEGDLSSLRGKNHADNGSSDGSHGGAEIASSASVDDLELMRLRERPIESLSDEELNRRFTDFINTRVAQMKRDRDLHPLLLSSERAP